MSRLTASAPLQLPAVLSDRAYVERGGLGPLELELGRFPVSTPQAEAIAAAVQGLLQQLAQEGYLRAADVGVSVAGLVGGAVPLAQLGADRLRPCVSITDYRLPGDDPADPGTATAWLGRALSAPVPGLFVPEGLELAISAPTANLATLTGKTLRGPGRLRFVAGALRLGSGAEVLGLKITGTGGTNASSGLSVLSGAADVLIRGCDVRDVQHNAVNINPSSNIRVISNRFQATGAVPFFGAYQGMGVYASGCVGLSVVDNDISATQGQGAVYLDGCTGWTLQINRIAGTAWRGVCCVGANTGGRILSNALERCGELYGTSTSAVGRNGIFVANTVSPWDIIAAGNVIDRTAENSIEGRLVSIGNVCMRAGYITGLATPSDEGVYCHADAIARGNIIVLPRGPGIKSYVGASGTGASIAGNLIYHPGRAGIDYLADGAGVVVADLLVNGNEIRGGNAPEQLGVNIRGINGATFTDARIRGQEVFGRASNVTPAGARVVLNSWQPDPLYAS